MFPVRGPPKSHGQLFHRGPPLDDPDANVCGARTFLLSCPLGQPTPLKSGALVPHVHSVARKDTSGF
eukprot:5001282-Pyramimonas_sp.AAC.1